MATTTTTAAAMLMMTDDDDDSVNQRLQNQIADPQFHVLYI